MRNGREPRRLRAVEALDSHVMAEPQPRSPQPGEERPNLVAVPAQGLSDGQMSFNAVEEEDEVLFRISVDALTGEDDLVSEGDADEGDADEGDADGVEADVVAEPEVEPEAAEVVAEPEVEVVAEPEVAAEVAAEPAEPAESVVAAEPKTVTEMAADLVAAAIADGLRAEAAPVAEVAKGEFEAEAPSTSLIADLAAHPLPYEPPQTPQVDDPSLQARLARIHLRTGSLSIARRELETLAGRNQLDTAGRLDLAEARWRTGDLHGAGEAASAYLAANGDEVLGFVIAAEASAMANRIAEARHYVEQAMQRYLSDLDPVFAGIARNAMWAEVVPAPAPTPVIETTPEPVQAAPAPVAVEPAVEPEAVVEPAPEPEAVVEPAAEPEPAPLPEPEAVVEPEPAEPEPAPLPEPEAVVEPVVESVLEAEPAVEQAAAPELVVEPEAEPEAVVEPEPAEPEPAEPEPEAVIEPAVEPEAVGVLEPVVELEPAAEPEPDPALEPEPEAVVEPVAEPEAAVEPVVEAEAPEDPAAAQADAEIAAGRAYLEGNDPLLAALHFGVALRLNQTRANAVIEAIGDRQDLPLQMVRSEAVRLLDVLAVVAPTVQSAVAEPSASVEELAPEPDAEPAPEPVAEPAPEPLAPPRAPEPPPIRWD